MKRLRDRLLTTITITVAILALIDQLLRRPEDRDWNGNIAGVPYDYRVPTMDRALERLWNPDDERVIVPTIVGVGWTFNLYQIKQRIQSLIG